MERTGVLPRFFFHFIENEKPEVAMELARKSMFLDCYA